MRSGSRCSARSGTPRRRRATAASRVRRLARRGPRRRGTRRHVVRRRRLARRRRPVVGLRVGAERAARRPAARAPPRPRLPRASAEFDVISDHTGPLAAALGRLSDAPVPHTVHGPVAGELGEAYEQIGRITPRLRLISLSRSQRRTHPSLPWVANCPNAIDPSRFSWSRARGEYLVFLGRMGPDKGCHHAIAVAQETGLPLKIAAKCREPAERAYFADRVAPHLGGAPAGSLGRCRAWLRASASQHQLQPSTRPRSVFPQPSR